MLRLASRIAVSGDSELHLQFGANESDHVSLARQFRDVPLRLRSVIGGSICVVADNIDYYLRISPDGQHMEDIPACLPIASPLFVEWTRDKRVLLGEGQSEVTITSQHGVLLETKEIEDSRRMQLEHELQDAKWVVDCHFVFTVRGEVCFYGASCELFLNSQGIALGRMRPWYMGGQQSSEKFKSEVMKTCFKKMSYVAMFAMSFANCKNVAKRDATEELGPPAKWIRRQKAPAIRYHVLEIDPSKIRTTSTPNPEADGPKKSLHICRGHFATYTEDKKLFGRYVGTFWVPAHVRGSKEFGVVEKDYSIKAPV